MTFFVTEPPDFTVLEHSARASGKTAPLVSFIRLFDGTPIAPACPSQDESLATPEHDRCEEDDQDALDHRVASKIRLEGPACTPWP